MKTLILLAFLWLSGSSPLTFSVSPNADPVVGVAVGMMQGDLQEVTGVRPQAVRSGAALRIVQYDRERTNLRRLGVPAAMADSLRFVKEAFYVGTSGGQLVVVGSDARGTAPAIYELQGEGASGGGDESGIKKVTVAEFNAAAESDTQKYQLTGTISGTINATYGNFDLVDDTGTVYVYGLTATELGYKATNDKSFGSLGLGSGDKITIIGYRGSHGGKIEVMYAYFVSKQ